MQRDEVAVPAPVRRGTRLRIALLGTRGVPARYGGFETCVEEVGRRLVERGHDVTVYCRRSGSARAGELSEANYEGMRLVHLPAVRRRSLETLTHTGLAVAHVLGHRPDVAVVFNSANAPFLPLLRAARVPVATHVDGLEWKRAKWSRAGRRYYRTAERLAVRWSDALIADSPAIAAYYRRNFGAETVQISYGAPILGSATERLADLGLTPKGYHLVVARLEPENNVEMIVRGYVSSRAKLPLVVVGSAPDDRVRFLGGLWDHELLDQLYVGTRTYLHGHSVGGTNPSLLRALGAGASIAAYDVVFNRDVVQDAGVFFSDERGVARCVEITETDPEASRAMSAAARARASHYDWDDVAGGYERLCLHLASPGTTVVEPGMSSHRPGRTL